MRAAINNLILQFRQAFIKKVETVKTEATIRSEKYFKNVGPCNEKALKLLITIKLLLITNNS